MEIKNGAQMTPGEMVAIATLLRDPTTTVTAHDVVDLAAAAFEALAKATACIDGLTRSVEWTTNQLIAAREKYDAAISELRGKVGR